jgi:hypothetical protein
MNAIDPYYSSLSDCCWFTGNIILKEKQPSTWFIDSSGFRSPDRYWKISVSEKTPSYAPGGNALALNHSRVTMKPSYRLV